jgi:hypothetical protein
MRRFKVENVQTLYVLFVNRLTASWLDQPTTLKFVRFQVTDLYSTFSCSVLLKVTNVGAIYTVYGLTLCSTDNIDVCRHDVDYLRVLM